VFVYVHGFGGLKEDPRFCENMRAFIQKSKVPCRIENYPWDSVKVDVLQAGASWLESQKRADQEAPNFKDRIIDRLEEEHTPYVLVGFSVGTRIIRGALERSNGKLESLRGVYFLGSAMTRDTSLVDGSLPPDMKIVNYHSPHRDKVHRTAFTFMSNVPAGGQAGFEDTAVFQNYPVSCTHAHKGVGVHIDYSQLAEAIGYLALFDEGILIPGDTGMNIPARVGDGDAWWNRIAEFECLIDGKPKSIEIEQHNMNSDYFRALRVDEAGTRKRIARGNNLHAIFESIGHESESSKRKLQESEQLQ
jgi:hypothetical protein